MNALIDLSWREYPASLILLIGLLVSGLGVWREVGGMRRPFRDPEKNVAWARGFRISMLGLAFTGIGAAWLFQQLWILVLALAISGEELLESTLIIFALTHGKDVRISIPARR